MSGVLVLQAEPVLDVKDQLGEGPLWHPGEQALYWVDIFGRRIHWLRPASGQHKTFTTVERITALGWRALGGLVVTTDKEFAMWDTQTQRLVPLAAPESLADAVRFNDGAVDPEGRFWAGTMNEEEPDAADGCLYRLDPDGCLHTMGTGFTIANGLGWSPDGTTLYFTDTSRRTIWAYDYEAASGVITNQRPFVRVPDGDGVPDGLTVDSEGGVWSAKWGGWKVTRYDPQGRIDREVHLATQNVTSCAFGGVDLDELYITTAQVGLSEHEQRDQPLAGDLFRTKVQIRGLEEPAFAG